jgi:hypothetical protein
MADKSTIKQKQIKQVRQGNVIESLKDLGGGVTKTFNEQLVKELPKDLMAQLMGIRRPPEKHFSGEIGRGDSLNVNDVYSGKREQQEKLSKQISFERRILDEERSLLDKRGRELQMQLSAITQEIHSVIAATPKLAKQVEAATLEAPVNPGQYHKIFLEAILEFLKSFRKNIESAGLWLASANKRSKKKGFWAQYEKKKGSRLLSPEDFLQRSAG